VKKTFLYQKYKKIVFELGLFIIGLIVFFGVSITATSGRYLGRFVEHNTQMTQSYFSVFKEDFTIRVSRWSKCPATKDAYYDGNKESLDQIFFQRVKTIGFPDVRILVREPGEVDYWYERKEIPLGLFESDANETHHENCFHWVGSDLWFTTSDQVDDYLVMLAVPIDHNNLEELALYLEGNLLKEISISHENILEKRDLFHWQRLRFSVPIDETVSAYLTYTFDMNSLAEYFYQSYGVTALLIVLFFIWIKRFRLRGLVVETSQQIKLFEGEIKQIDDGNYSKKIDKTGYLEFDRLGAAVNHLTDTIEERNRELSDHVQELYGLLIQVLEQKDPYTRGHSERVAKYAKGIAEILGLENSEEIHAAGLLHDIGKISIQESMLNKAGHYTDAEYEIVKGHAQKGYELLLESKQFHRISTWVLYHHERINGSGYPRGLKGHEIPYEARIIAVADVFDAMTSDRSYREALSVEETMTYLHECEGECFEKTIVDAMEVYSKASSQG
jgi:putative nucleotidyltransferase with HDIG domain